MTKTSKVQEKERIAFHDFRANYDGKYVNITEVGKEYRNGRIKDRNIQLEDFHHPVEIVFLDKSGKRIKSQFIEHPLIKEYEYADEDGSLGMVTSYSESASFMLRYNLIKDLYKLRFTSINQDTLVINEEIRTLK